ncbi:LysR family transcriptional regulator [Nannocystis pusilla]|uniref:LysR family transcriptional regulator n=1 Tax=Nannocystis pusilla TaxID=889268 RepID=UPI003BF37D23
MHRSGLIELEAVLAVARRRSFRAAAADLGMSPTALGNAVAHLEERLAVRLFHRTTRSVALTAAGEAFVAEVAPAVAAIASATERARTASAELSGTLRINSSLGGARQLLTLAVAEFGRRYPAVTVELVTDRRMVDIVREGFDAGIRSRESVPRDMIRVPIGGSLSFVIVGSPAYLRAHGRPATPDDLARHRCVRVRTASGAEYRWPLERGRKRLEVAVSGSLIVDEPHLMLEACRRGVGLAYLPRWLVDADLAQGHLAQVLDDWTPETPGLCLYYPTGRNPPAPLRAFVALIRAARRTGVDNQATATSKPPNAAGKPR